jgi:micrococcal nuclease
MREPTLFGWHKGGGSSKPRCLAISLNSTTDAAMRIPLAIAPLALIPATSWAHHGGLNSSGCHTNRTTGDYHCHSSTGGIGQSSSGTIQITPIAVPTPRRSAPKPTAPSASGPVTLVSMGDSDTIRVIARKGQKVTVRLACIDAPETAHGESGTQATAYLRKLLSAGSLEIRPKAADRYGRTLAEVYAVDRNINLEMVRQGMAYAYRDYLDGCDANAYLEAESLSEPYGQIVWRSGNEVKP